MFTALKGSQFYFYSIFTFLFPKQKLSGLGADRMFNLYFVFYSPAHIQFMKSLEEKSLLDLRNQQYQYNSIYFSKVSHFIVNIRKTCPSNVYPPHTPLLYSKTGVRRGIPIFSSPEPLGSQGELIGWP